MKKILLFSIIFISLIACKKKEFSPEGPTAVRVKNVSDIHFLEVKVNISDSIKIMGDVPSRGFSEYILFHKAFPKAEISAKVTGTNGQILFFSTGTVNYNAMTYIGQAKITYEVFISDYNNNKLEISNCSLDAPLD